MKQLEVERDQVRGYVTEIWANIFQATFLLWRTMFSFDQVLRLYLNSLGMV